MSSNHLLNHELYLLNNPIVLTHGSCQLHQNELISCQGDGILEYF